MLYFAFDKILKLHPPLNLINLTQILKTININIGKTKNKYETYSLELNFENGISIEKETFLRLINCKKLNRLCFKKNSTKIIQLKSKCFNGLVNLNDLYLNGCGIEKIELNSFSPQLNNLIELDLSENNLKEIEENIFSNLKYFKQF